MAEQRALFDGESWGTICMRADLTAGEILVVLAAGKTFSAAGEFPLRIAVDPNRTNQSLIEFAELDRVIHSTVVRQSRRDARWRAVHNPARSAQSAMTSP